MTMTIKGSCAFSAQIKSYIYAKKLRQKDVVFALDQIDSITFPFHPGYPDQDL